MKRIYLISIVVIILVVLTCCSKKETVNWESYGDAALQAGVVPIQTLLSDPMKLNGKNVTVKGKVVGVCKGSGCWVEIDDGSGETIIAKSLDHSVSVPMDCEGRQIEVTGKVTVIPASAEEDTVHVKTEIGGEEHECPKPSVLVTMECVKLAVPAI